MRLSGLSKRKPFHAPPSKAILISCCLADETYSNKLSSQPKMNSAQRPDGINLSALAVGLKPPKAIPSAGFVQSKLDSSLVSFDTSSGCSSAGSSSLIDSPGSSSSKYHQLDTAGGVAGGSERAKLDRQSLRDTDDHLEVNELLYLPKRKHKPTRDHQGQANLYPELASIQRAAGVAMSEFSAFTLRKRLSRVKIDRSSSLSADRAATLGNPSKKTVCSCCCCSARCSTGASPQTKEAGRSRAHHRQQEARGAARSASLSRSLSTQRDQAGTRWRGSMGARRISGTLTGTVRRQQLRLLAVPPPVVPLFKELQLLELGADSAGSAGSTLRKSPPNRAGSLNDVSRGKVTAIRDSYSSNWRSLDAPELPTSLSKSCSLLVRADEPHEQRRLALSFLAKVKRSLLKLSADKSAQSVPAAAVPASKPAGELDQAGRAYEIYDTPEFNAQTGSPLRKPVVRPSIPPPPPPPLLVRLRECGAPMGAETKAPKQSLEQDGTRRVNSLADQFSQPLSSSLALVSKKEQAQEKLVVEEKKRKAVKWAQDGEPAPGLADPQRAKCLGQLKPVLSSEPQLDRAEPADVTDRAGSRKKGEWIMSGSGRSHLLRLPLPAVWALPAQAVCRRV